MENPVQRLGRYVEDRRTALGLTQEEVNANGGPSDTTLSKLEGGVAPEPSRLTLQRLDRGLQWEPGSARKILAGGEPTPARRDFETLTVRVPVAELPETGDPTDLLARSYERTMDFVKLVAEHPDLAKQAWVMGDMASRLFVRAVQDSSPINRLSEPAAKPDLAIAAHEDGDIAGEQETRNDP